MRITQKQRDLVSGGVINLGNISAAALVFGQFFRKAPLEVPALIAGALFTGFCYLIGILVTGGD